MKEFRDLDALCRVLTKAIERCPADIRRAEFAALLVSRMEFRPSDAELYASVVLGANAADSPQRAHALGSELTGRWGRGSDAGSAGNRFSALVTGIVKSTPFQMRRYEGVDSVAAGLQTGPGGSRP